MILNILLLSSFFIQTAFAEAPVCPVPSICSTLYKSQKNCTNGVEKACDHFVIVLKKSFPKYNCKRSFDSQSFVPAIWLCSGAESYLRFLSNMKSSDARKLYGSPEFKNVLNARTEERLKDLKKAERKLKNKS